MLTAVDNNTNIDLKKHGLNSLLEKLARKDLDDIIEKIAEGRLEKIDIYHIAKFKNAEDFLKSLKIIDGNAVLIVAPNGDRLTFQNLNEAVEYYNYIREIYNKYEDIAINIVLSRIRDIIIDTISGRRL